MEMDKQTDDTFRPVKKPACSHPNLVTIGTFFKCPDCGMTRFACTRSRSTGTATARSVRRKK